MGITLAGVGAQAPKFDQRWLKPPTSARCVTRVPLLPPSAVAIRPLLRFSSFRKVALTLKSRIHCWLSVPSHGLTTSAAPLCSESALTSRQPPLLLV